MNVIVTPLKTEYNGFLKLSSIKEVSLTKGSIDFLVYNKSNEDSDEIVACFKELQNRVGTIIYICDERSINLVVKMLVVGYGGHYFDDEFFLESSTELNNLVSSLDEITEIAELGGVSVLSDFLNRYLKNGSTSFSGRYLVSVKEAVQVLMEEYSEKNMELIRMSETATELFSNTSELLSGMRKEHNELKKNILKLEGEVKKNSSLMQKTQSSSALPSLLYYPQISYMKEKKIIRIKEIGNVMFLISFVLGLRIYLENIKNVRPKLIIVESIGSLNETQYKEWSWVTQSKVKDKRLYYEDVVFTNCPNKEVLCTLLDDEAYDTFIVVDRLKSKNHVLNSRGSLFYAISGASCIKRYSLPGKNCFASVKEVKGTMFTIPVFANYPEEKSFRERMYLQDVGKLYNMLY